MVGALSLPCVGARFPNKKHGNRQFEIAVCAPSEPVLLEHEPKNPADQNAIRVVSVRGIQMGYIAADRTWLIHRAWQGCRDVRAIFQAPSPTGCWLRVTFDGSEPILPPPTEQPKRPPELPEGADPDSDFWPDEMPADE